MTSVAAFKLQFFSSKAVTDKLDPATRKVLGWTGAVLRRTAKSSLKYGTKSSPVGKPPTVHRSSGFTRKKKVKGVATLQPSSPFRELIFFAYDPARKSVVVGPALGGSQSGAPETLEYGGTTTIQRGGRSVTIRVGARPTMQPALEKEQENIVQKFKDII